MKSKFSFKIYDGGVSIWYEGLWIIDASDIRDSGEFQIASTLLEKISGEGNRNTKFRVKNFNPKELK
jgi:hypothetical protein